MRFEIACLLVAVVVSAYATSAVAPSAEEEKRSFVSGATFTFTTFTLIKATTTTTSTFTSITTCTTSTSALSTCTVGGRRRGLFFDEKDGKRARRGLFYNDDAENLEGAAFLPVEKKTSDPVEETPKVSASEDAVIPLEIQPGFNLPEGATANRFLLAFGTSTITSVVIATSTVSLTAICSSTTGFALCASGK